MDTPAAQLRSAAALRSAPRARRAALPFLALLAVGICVPAVRQRLLGRDRHPRRVYWVLVAGLNLVVGFAGQLAIGYVALLTLGAYTASVLVRRQRHDRRCRPSGAGDRGRGRRGASA